LTVERHLLIFACVQDLLKEQFAPGKRRAITWLLENGPATMLQKSNSSGKVSLSPRMVCFGPGFNEGRGLQIGPATKFLGFD
jgi:hypothetical protein